jgi:hypothetical protein
MEFLRSLKSMDDTRKKKKKKKVIRQEMQMKSEINAAI